MRNITGGIVAGFFTCLGTLAAGGEALLLVEAGRPRAQIVIPENAVPVVKLAAEELQYHILRATDAELAIVPESEADPELPHRIYLGDGQATRQAGIAFPGEVDPAEEYARRERVKWGLRTVGPDLFLAGSDNEGRPGDRFGGTRHGTLFAVYEFLETELGVRWLWPGELGEVIPRRQDLAVGPLDREGMERFAEAEYSSKKWLHGIKTYWRSSTHFDAFAEAQSRWLLRHRMGVRNTITYNYGHYFHDVGGYTARFLNPRPDFFQKLPDGTRGYIPGMRGHVITMCVSNPDLHRQMIEDWQGYRRQHDLVRRGGKIGAGAGWMLNACENDQAASCTCEACRAWDAPDPRFDNHDYWSEGILITDPAQGNVRYQMSFPDSQGRPAPSLSDRYARFYRTLQEKAAEVDPSAVIFGYAYSNYAEPPQQTKLNDRIVISMVHWPYFPWTEADVSDMKQTWEQWHATGARLKLRPNTMLTGHNFPVFLARQLGEVFAHHARQGMEATWFDSLTGQWASKGPDLYVLTRMHVRPDWPVEKVLEEYYAGFGPAEAEVRKYFEHWEQVSEQAAKNPPDSVQTSADDAAEGGGWAGFRQFVRHAPHIFPPEAMRKGRGLIEKALEAAAGDPLAQRRVAFLEKGLTHAELTLAVARAYADMEGDERNPQKRMRLASAMTKLMDFRRDVVEPEMLSNVGFLAWHEERRNGWNHSLDFARDDAIWRLTPPVRESIHELPVGWHFRKDPQDSGLADDWARAPLNDAWQPIRTDAPWTGQDAGKGYHGAAWYALEFTLPEAARAAIAQARQTPGAQPALTFGAVDGDADIFLNGIKIGAQKIPPEVMWDKEFSIPLPADFDPEAPQRLAVRVRKDRAAAGIWRPVRVTAVAGRENLVANPSFEEASLGGEARGWYILGDNPALFRHGVTDSDAVEGRRSFEVNALRRDERGELRLAQKIRETVPGQHYELSVWVKTDANFRGRFLISGGGQPVYVNATNGQWREITLPVTEATGDYIYLAIWFNLATGRILVDNVRCMAVEDPQP